MMGDLQVCSLPSQNGVLFGEKRVYPLQSSSSPLLASNPEPALISSESWDRAETMTQEIVSRIQPTQVADQKRRDIIEYVQRLIRFYTGCEVFPYGSVPLKTYLPDGDIDLTAFSHANANDAIVSDVHAVLRGEEHNEAAQFKVKEVHCIDAEVKLVKCIVEDVVVDISFNQLGGLGTLCFLEQVDRLTGNDHLFKRSIILIKAWCFYESRILGAPHGLISTYALETLVLYIFHLFHTSLKCPFAVLYRFLDYFSKFDWENYCLSLKGPVCKSSLPDIVAEIPGNEMGDLLLTEEFLRNCRDMFSVSSNGLETNLRVFPMKHLNIIDPLKENNNLGRSVNRGNFYRIRSAFKFGTRKLGWILSLSGERMADELKKFFANTLDGHGSNCSKNMVDSTLASGVKVSEYVADSLRSEPFSERKNFTELTGCFKIKGIDVVSSLRNKPERHYLKTVSPQFVHQVVHCLDGEVKQPAASGILDTRCTNDSSGCFPVGRCLSTLVPVRSRHHYCILPLQSRNRKTDNCGPCEETLAEYSATDDEMSSNCPLEQRKKHLGANDLACSCINMGDKALIDPTVLTDVTNVLKNMDHKDKDNAGIFGTSEALKLLLDLGGDYDSHFRNLHYGQLFLVYARSGLAFTSPLSPLLQNKNLWESVCKFSQFLRNVNPRSSRNGVAFGPRSANNFSVGEENRKPRGTGTYFPKMNFRPYKDRRLRVKEWSPVLRAFVPLQTHAESTGLDMAPDELSTSVECKHELSQAEYPVLGSRNSGSSDYYQSNLSAWESFHSNTSSRPSEKLDNTTSCPQMTWTGSLPERINPPDHGTLHHQGSPLVPVASAMPNSQPLSASCQASLKEQAYHLKDEDDFPPLCTI
ncbi:hypothetical protein PanWU01x14_318290 [Parasponia andersonii]|uniref:PAP/OAS1 substrate-binding domain superfamily n=1 Tax=Parasponia andersonii TaxID=3476 RepID=A0A2P5AMJ7_PARAD|nr:hypothetical protein PanWU01x14_318290 [Parasponia andersonii]